MYRKYLCCLALACSSVLLPLHLSAQEAVGQPLVSYDQSHPLMPQNSAPMVRVFESGAVEVNRASGNKRPGSYQLSITDQRLAHIRFLLASSSGVEAAITLITQEKAAATTLQRAGEKTLTIESDPTTTVIAVNQSALQARNTAALAPQGEAMQVIAIESLTAMSESSNKPTIKSMRELEVFLLGLYERAGK